MIRDCKHCGIEFEDNSFRKREVGASSTNALTVWKTWALRLHLQPSV